MLFSEDKFATILEENNLLEQGEIEEIRSKVKKEDLDLYQYVVSQDIVDKDDLGSVLADMYNVDYVDLEDVEIDSEAVNIISEVVARKNNSIIFDQSEGAVKVAMFNPSNEDFIKNIKEKIRQRFKRNEDLLKQIDEETKTDTKEKSKEEIVEYAKEEYDIGLNEEQNKDDLVDDFFEKLENRKEELSEKTDKEIEIYFAHRKDIEKAINDNYESSSDEFSQLIQGIIDREGGEMEPEDMPVIKIVDRLLDYAYKNKASDIHIEPYEDKTLIRFRIDGILHDIISIPKSLHNLIITRIKILARLRTDEHRAAQDGKLTFTHDGESIDVRVSIVPIVYGEKAVLRLLAETTGQFTLENLGFREEDLEKIEESIESPWGMILATGPTGSGKTTTLYTILKELNTREVNISTIEDPVEYGVESINQIQVNEDAGLTFSNGLRAIVRQDPDIIMVGEIRDEETAQIAVNAALTGHLVLSTLHTNDASTTLPRLLDMGVQPFLVASTINVAIAQRLVREICENCKREIEVKEETKELIKKQLSEELIDKYDLDKKDLTVYEGAGCTECQDSGYQGRVGVYEVLEMNSEIKNMVMEKANASEIEQKAKDMDMLPLVEAGLLKVLDGTTTFEELFRVAQG